MTIDFSGVTDEPKFVFARTCQECGHRQLDKEPKNPTDAYNNKKCKKCKSQALDFGHNGFIIQDGKIERV